MNCNLGPEDDTRHYGQRTNKGRDLDKTQHCPPRGVKRLAKRKKCAVDQQQKKPPLSETSPVEMI